jgi:hypothetical protein
LRWLLRPCDPDFDAPPHSGRSVLSPNLPGTMLLKYLRNTFFIAWIIYSDGQNYVFGNTVKPLQRFEYVDTCR